MNIRTTTGRIAVLATVIGSASLLGSGLAQAEEAPPIISVGGVQLPTTPTVEVNVGELPTDGGLGGLLPGVTLPDLGGGLPLPDLGGALPLPDLGGGLPLPDLGGEGGLIPGVTLPDLGGGLPLPDLGGEGGLIPGVTLPNLDGGVPLPDLEGVEIVPGVPLPDLGNVVPLPELGDGVPLPDLGDGLPVPGVGGALPDLTAVTAVLDTVLAPIMAVLNALGLGGLLALLPLPIL